MKKEKSQYEKLKKNQNDLRNEKIRLQQMDEEISKQLKIYEEQ